MQRNGPSLPLSNSHQTQANQTPSNSYQTHSNLDTNFRWTTGPALSRILQSWSLTLLLRNEIYKHCNIPNNQSNPNLTHHQFNPHHPRLTTLPTIHQLSLLKPRNRQSSSNNIDSIHGNLHLSNYLLHQSTTHQRASTE
ncbi:hypothetical protein DFH28DRAFT_888861, partial [Melampsora americana]